MNGSSLFNLSTINESVQTTQHPKLVTVFNTNSNLSTITTALDNFNESAVGLEKDMILAVAEADSTKAENEAMSQYFRDYSKEVTKLVQKIDQQRSKFAINIEVFMDANKDIDNELANMTEKEISYKKTIYKNLTNPDFPKISPKKIFKREYRILGKLLQDLNSSSVSDEARVTAIASVYDALINSMDEDWLEKCIEMITGEDDCGTDEFAETMYKKFCIGAKVITINSAEVNQAKFTIANAATASRQIQDSFNTLSEELTSIASDIEDMWFRNKDNVLDIKIDADGVLDAKYQLTDYSMNRVNRIIKAKIDQLNEVANLYLIALSIKMDCLVRSLKQAREIINIAITGVEEIHDQDDEYTIDTEDNGVSKPEELPEDEDFGNHNDDEMGIDFENISDNTDNELEINNESLTSIKANQMKRYPITYIIYCDLTNVLCDASDLILFQPLSKYVSYFKSHNIPEVLQYIKTIKDKKELKKAQQYISITSNIIGRLEKKLKKYEEKSDKGRFASDVLRNAAKGALYGVAATSTANQNVLNELYKRKVKSEDLAALKKWIDTNVQRELSKKEKELSKNVSESVYTDTETDFEKSCYLFETSLSRISLLNEQIDMYQSIQAAILEDGEQNNNNQQQNNQSSNNQVAKTNQKVDDAKEKMNNMIATLVNKLRELVKKFVDVFVNRNQTKINKIKDNQATIRKNGAKGGGTAIIYNVDAIKSMDINIDYASNKDVLDTQENFVKKAFNVEMKDGKSFAEVLNEKVIGDGKPQPVTIQHIETGMKYVLDEFKGIVDSVQKAQNTITTKSKNAKLEANRYMNESTIATLESTTFEYFTEAFEAPENKSNTVDQAKEVHSDVTKKLMLMYKTNALLLSTKMSLAQKAFNEYYAICSFFINNTIADNATSDNQNKNNKETGNSVDVNKTIPKR